MRSIQSATIGTLVLLAIAFAWYGIATKQQILQLQKDLTSSRQEISTIQKERQIENQSFRDRLLKLESAYKPIYQVVSKRELVKSKTFANIHVECPEGKKVVGGGFSIETPNDIKVFHSLPSDGNGNLIDHGWNVAVQNNGTASRQTTAVGVCVSAE